MSDIQDDPEDLIFETMNGVPEDAIPDVPDEAVLFDERLDTDLDAPDFDEPPYDDGEYIDGDVDLSQPEDEIDSDDELDDESDADNDTTVDDDESDETFNPLLHKIDHDKKVRSRSVGADMVTSDDSHDANSDMVSDTQSDSDGGDDNDDMSSDSASETESSSSKASDSLEGPSIGQSSDNVSRPGGPQASADVKPVISAGGSRLQSQVDPASGEKNKSTDFLSSEFDKAYRSVPYVVGDVHALESLNNYETWTKKKEQVDSYLGEVTKGSYGHNPLLRESRDGGRGSLLTNDQRELYNELHHSSIKDQSRATMKDIHESIDDNLITSIVTAVVEVLMTMQDTDPTPRVESRALYDALALMPSPVSVSGDVVPDSSESVTEFCEREFLSDSIFDSSNSAFSRSYSEDALTTQAFARPTILSDDELVAVSNGPAVDIEKLMVESADLDLDGLLPGSYESKPVMHQQVGATDIESEPHRHTEKYAEYGVADRYLTKEEKAELIRQEEEKQAEREAMYHRGRMNHRHSEPEPLYTRDRDEYRRSYRRGYDRADGYERRDYGRPYRFKDGYMSTDNNETQYTPGQYRDSGFEKFNSQHAFDKFGYVPQGSMDQQRETYERERDERNREIEEMRAYIARLEEEQSAKDEIINHLGAEKESLLRDNTAMLDDVRSLQRHVNEAEGAYEDLYSAYEALERNFRPRRPRGMRD